MTETCSEDNDSSCHGNDLFKNCCSTFLLLTCAHDWTEKSQSCFSPRTPNTPWLLGKIQSQIWGSKSEIHDLPHGGVTRRVRHSTWIHDVAGHERFRSAHGLALTQGAAPLERGGGISTGTMWSFSSESSNRRRRYIELKRTERDETLLE